MRILLLGGTGAMGIHLSQILASDKNNQITVTSRSKRQPNGNIEYILGNAHNNDFIEKVLLKTKWDIIVDFMVYNTLEFQSRVKLLLDSCSQYIFLSSSRVYAEQKNSIKEENSRLIDVCKDSEYLSTDEYGLSKARQEDILIYSGKKNWTIIRPYITYAENRLQLGVLELNEWLYRALLGHTIVFSQDIANCTTTLTYGFDVARGIASIIGDEKAYGRIFHITNPTPIKWSHVLEIYQDAIEEYTGKRPKVKMVSEHPYINNKSRKYQVIYDRRYNRTFDNSSINEFIDIASLTPVEDGLKKSLHSFITENKSLNFNLSPVHEGFYDRITGERMDLGYFKSNKSKVVYLLQRYLPFVLRLLQLIR